MNPFLVSLVYSVYLVCLVYVVYLVFFFHLPSKALFLVTLRVTVFPLSSLAPLPVSYHGMKRFTKRL